jgi:hypothetical protein
MPRETAIVKADRLLTSRRVHVLRVISDEVDAVVRGDHGVYVVARRRGRFVCSCAAIGQCSHGRAVAAVVGS